MQMRTEVVQKPYPGRCLNEPQSSSVLPTPSRDVSIAGTNPGRLGAPFLHVCPCQDTSGGPSGAGMPFHCESVLICMAGKWSGYWYNVEKEEGMWVTTMVAGAGGTPNICTVASVTHKLTAIERGRLTCHKGSRIHTNKSWTDVASSYRPLSLPFSFSPNPFRWRQSSRCILATRHYCGGRAQTDLRHWRQISYFLPPQFSLSGTWLTTLQLWSHFFAMTAAVLEYLNVHLFSSRALTAIAST